MDWFLNGMGVMDGLDSAVVVLVIFGCLLAWLRANGVR